MKSFQISKMLRRILSIGYPLVLIIVLLIVTESVSQEIEKDSIPKVKSTFEEEHKVFENDYPKRRSKRFVYYNVDSNLDVGYLLVTPITIVLPQMSNLFNKWRKRRSVRSLEEMQDVFEDHPAVQSNLERISMYFELVDIPENNCQLRAICEFSAEPSKFFPLSDLILNRLRDPAIPGVAFDFDEKSSGETSIETLNNSTLGEMRPRSLFKMYTTAANTGLAYGSESCQKNYGSQCKYSMDKLLSMTAFRIWSAMWSQFGFNIKDDFKF